MSTNMTQRQVRAKQTKKKILDTALSLLNKKHFNDITVDEIVTLSNTSKGAFYTHFKSKYEILLEKFKEVDHFYEEIARSLPAEISSTEKIVRFSESQMVYLRDDWGKETYLTLYTNASPEHNYFMNKDRALYRMINQFVQEGQETGEFKQDLSPDEITALIARCMRGTLFDWCIQDDRFDLVTETKKLIRTFLEGLKP
ncbi:TetR/AcrR family transcriptional regulator [Ammoniphilus sp. 3BR4]|uniref:TetR/AcrR family transcriptional regulator n=1 Tax=Ammoniphilus sp. 3BR4 TaxID=3158265 RepID=UPI0034650ADD